MQAWYASEPYQRLRLAVRARDYAAISQIIDEQLEVSSGADRAFWLMVRMGKWTQYPATRMIDRAWADLEEALRTAPDHPDIQQSVLYISLGLAVQTERTDRMANVVRLLGPRVRHLQTDPRFWYNLGVLHMRRGQWKPAMQSLGRSAAGFPQQSQEFRDTFGCFLMTIHAFRAICAIACGLAEEAPGAIAQAEQVQQSLVTTNKNPVVIGLARAELALHEGQWHEARSVLQAAVIAEGWDPGQISASPLMIDVDLLAARVARAEGNQAGFGHFCEKALARAEHHDLPITSARIQRVMAGAER